VRDSRLVRFMQKKRNNSQANPSEFAYVRVALGLALEISSDAIDALAFSMSRYIRIEHNVRYSVVLFFFALEIMFGRALCLLELVDKKYIRLRI